MAYTFSELSPLMIRMTAEDRQSINRMIQHKRQEFESVMKKGIVAMLNAQEEHDKLVEKRAEYSSFLSLKNHRKKTALTHLTSEARDISQGAPMGIGVGAQLVLAGTNTLGQAILNEGEERRQAQEAEDNLYSAQMLYYIPPQNYEPIAERVAGILSYRYQFLIFRLAPGEHGYIKLAEFFLKSMKSYAISRLREQKNNVISALINAAIPPSTDALSYRDYPSIDVIHFRMNLSKWGSRTLLALDEDANHLVERCGPAVRTFLGGSRTYVDPLSLKLKSHHEYTVLGVLNHASILNGSGRVMAGLLTSQGHSISFYGNMKYPMILLSQDETTAHLGVNFATRITDYILEPIHYIVLKRLVPDFLNHRSCYQLREVKDTKFDNFEAYRYSEERLECPWSKHREGQLQTRLLSMYAAAKAEARVRPTEMDSVDTLSVMLNAGHEDTLKLQRMEIQASKTLLLDGVRKLFSRELSENNQKKQQIQALNQATYAAKTVTQFLKFMLAAHRVSENDFKEVKHMIELVNLTIYACRSNLIREAACLDRVLHAKEIAQVAADRITLGGQLASFSIQLLMELVQNGTHDEQSEALCLREAKLRQHMIKNYKTQVRDSIQGIKKMIQVGEMFVGYDTDYAKIHLDMTDTITDFEAAVKQFRTSHQTQPMDVGNKFVDFFSDIIFDATFYYEEIKEASRQEGCIFIQSPSWAEGLLLEDKSEHEKKEEILKAIEGWVAELNQYYQSVKDAVNRYSMWTNRAQFISRLNHLKQEAIVRRDKIVASYQALTYVSEKFRTLIDAYLLRAKHQDEFSSLYNLAYQSGCNIETLNTSAKRLYLSYCQVALLHAKTEGEAIISQYERFPSDISWESLQERAAIVSRAKENLELKVRDDVELIALASTQLFVVYREKFQNLQDMRDIEGRISYFCEEYEHISNSKPANQGYLACVQDKVSRLIEKIKLLGIEDAFFGEHLSSEFEKFSRAWSQNHVEHREEKGVVFLAKLLQWINRKYRTERELDQAMQVITTQKESVTCIVNQDPLELLAARKSALRAVMEACEHIQKANLWHEQNELGLVLSNPVKHSDLARDVLVWSGSLSLTERAWLDHKHAALLSCQSQQIIEYKPPVRKVYSFLSVLVIDQIAQKKLDLGKLRKIETCAKKMRLGQLNSESLIAADYLNMVELRKTILHECTQQMLCIEKELTELHTLNSKMIDQGLRLFFMEWRRKVRDLPSEEVIFKKKCRTLLPGIEILPLAEAAEHETNIGDLDDMLEKLQLYLLTHGQDGKGSPSKSISYSLFSDSPNSCEDGPKPKLNHDITEPQVLSGKSGVGLFS